MPIESQPSRFAREVAEFVSDPVVVFDRSGAIVQANPAAAREWGIAPERAPGLTLRQLGVAEDDAVAFGQALVRAIETRSGETLTLRFESACGPRARRAALMPDGDSVVAVLARDGCVSGHDIEERTRVEEELRASEARYRSLVDNIPSVLMRFGPDLRVVFLSPRAEAFTGIPSSSFLGRTNRELGMPAELCDLWDAAILDVFANGTTRDIEFELPVGGEPRAFLLRLVPEFESDGTVRHVLGISTDITDRRRAETALRDSERIYRAIGESIDWGVWICDPLGRNIYASDSFLRLVGLTQEQCSGVGWGDVLHPDDAARTIAAWQQTVSTGASWWDIEHRFLGVDGQYHAVLARGVPVRNERGEIVCWAGINLDIDRMKRTEAALRASREELSEADHRKDEFLALLSHELRNPLAPIRNSFRLLRDAPAGSPAAVRALEVGERQVAHLTRLVDDLLDINRIARGKIELARQPLDLAEVLRQTIADHRASFEARSVALEADLRDEPAWVVGDPVRLAQVIGNLLQNAAKFSEPGGRVDVRLALTDDAVRIEISDTGVGIDPAFLHRIFEPFAQLDTSTGRGSGGLGLGLALVARLLGLHGGNVEARSDGPGKGATFTARLPRAGVSPASTRPVEPARPGRLRRVLVVEDNEDAADSLRLLLEMRGHAVDVSHSGSAAFERFVRFRPDAVICDIGLPDMDGHDVARRLRAMASGPLQLIALTGFGMDVDRARAKDAGFDAHLVKPADLALLQQLLEHE